MRPRQRLGGGRWSLDTGSSWSTADVTAMGEGGRGDGRGGIDALDPGRGGGRLMSCRARSQQRGHDQITTNIVDGQWTHDGAGAFLDIGRRASVHGVCGVWASRELGNEVAEAPSVRRCPPFHPARSFCLARHLSQNLRRPSRPHAVTAHPSIHRPPSRDAPSPSRPIPPRAFVSISLIGIPLRRPRGPHHQHHQTAHTLHSLPTFAHAPATRSTNTNTTLAGHTTPKRAASVSQRRAPPNPSRHRRRRQYQLLVLIPSNAGRTQTLNNNPRN